MEWDSLQKLEQRSAASMRICPVPLVGTFAGRRILESCGVCRLLCTMWQWLQKSLIICNYLLINSVFCQNTKRDKIRASCVEILYSAFVFVESKDGVILFPTTRATTGNRKGYYSEWTPCSLPSIERGTQSAAPTQSTMNKSLQRSEEFVTPSNNALFSAQNL